MEVAREPSRELGSAELARRLSLSRESVHQLLLPLVRAGFLSAVRGRTGGYRAAEGALLVSVASITALYDSAPSSADRGREGPRALAELEFRAEKARREVLERTTLGDVVASVRAESEALSWEV